MHEWSRKYVENLNAKMVAAKLSDVNRQPVDVWSQHRCMRVRSSFVSVILISIIE